MGFYIHVSPGKGLCLILGSEGTSHSPAGWNPECFMVTQPDHCFTRMLWATENQQPLMVTPPAPWAASPRYRPEGTEQGMV